MLWYEQKYHLQNAISLRMLVSHYPKMHSWQLFKKLLKAPIIFFFFFFFVMKSMIYLFFKLLIFFNLTSYYSIVPELSVLKIRRKLIVHSVGMETKANCFS